MNRTFDVVALRFHCAALKSGCIDANFLRGGLGKALRESDRDAYERWFAPRASEGPSGLRDSPRAFVIRVAEQRVEAGAEFSFGLNLFDPEATDRVVRAFKRFLRVESVEGREVLRLPLESTRSASHVRVLFVTPTELKGADQPEFGVLFARLRDRISTLGELYQEGPLEIDFKAMSARAAQIKMTRCELERVESERVSRRKRHPLGGFVGFAEYEGELGEFLPYLEIGRYTGVGRQTVWGKGEIHAVVA
ncbi:MAG TPA: CRISPR system precrRNA processing endoribonuclease RAMP protein Cas6 [Bryobacteraceae bacterium]|nr:CRISPR system precrRNA processing endoribonuclease RAMP protein Cas6 [Bryobacteraceae bacterium]